MGRVRDHEKGLGVIERVREGRVIKRVRGHREGSGIIDKQILVTVHNSSLFNRFWSLAGS